MEATSYTGASIQVLEGLEPVRKRPGMYIGGTGKPGLHHLLWEIVDNAVDEATNGFASLIEVTLHADGRSATVYDNGRGIPVDLHPVKKVSSLEVILTTLHAGGKFDSGAYITSGGLHGVGSSVVNALSDELVATIRKDGAVWEQRFARGVPVTKLKRLADAPRGTGTTIFFRPDPTIFETTAFDAAVIRENLEVKTYLNGKLRIVFKDEQAKTREEFHHEGGVVEFLGAVLKAEKARPVHADAFAVSADLGGGQRVEVALQWTEAPRENVRSFVNGIPTRDGGTHEQGFKDAVRSAVRAYMDTHNLVPKNLDVSAEDLREGLFAVVSLYLVDPQFQGQTKEKLNNPEARGLVVSALRLELERWLTAHPSVGDAIATRVVQAAKARLASRAAAKEVRRKTAVSHRLNLPGKLADCSATDPSVSELFIVEGDSAGGSAKQGRDRATQAILPLRGKVLNTEQATAAKVKDNKELADIVTALGCDLGDGLDLSKLRYGKVILLMDADADGAHIATLLLTFFYRHMRPLIENGHVYLAQPPLYRVDAGKETFWALDDSDRDKILKTLAKKRVKPEIQRFKGLGEMMPQTLKETTLDPSKRRLVLVTIPDAERMLTETTVSELMGKDASARYRFLVEHARDVDVEELDV